MAEVASIKSITSSHADKMLAGLAAVLGNEPIYRLCRVPDRAPAFSECTRQQEVSGRVVLASAGVASEVLCLPVRKLLGTWPKGPQPR
jgi:hypothetical protein